MSRLLATSPAASPACTLAADSARTLAAVSARSRSLAVISASFSLSKCSTLLVYWRTSSSCSDIVQLHSTPGSGESKTISCSCC